MQVQRSHIYNQLIQYFLNTLYLCFVYSIKLLTSAYLWVRAPKHWVIDYTQFTTLPGPSADSHDSFRLSSSIPLYMIYVGSSHTISVQESDHVQATGTGPSLFSSLSGHTGNIWKTVVQVLILSLQTSQRQATEVSLVPLSCWWMCTIYQNQVYAYMIPNNFMPSFLQSCHEMYRVNKLLKSIYFNETIWGTPN